MFLRSETLGEGVPAIYPRSLRAVFGWDSNLSIANLAIYAWKKCVCIIRQSIDRLSSYIKTARLRSVLTSLKSIIYRIYKKDHKHQATEGLTDTGHRLLQQP